MAAALHLLGGATVAVETWAPDVAVLNGLEVGVVTAVTELTCDLMQHHTGTGGDGETLARLEGVSSTSGVKAKPLRTATRAMIGLLRGARKYACTVGQVFADCTALGMTEATANAISAAWGTHSGKLLAVAASHATPAIAPLVDAEWRFGVSVSTDDLAKVGSTYVHMRLVLDVDGSLHVETMELTLTQFYNVLSQLEKAKSYVDYLSGVVGVTSGAGGK